MDNKEDSIKELLLGASEIRNKWNDVFDKTGERFNLFEILGLTSNETKTHSAFIGELLNPNAFHGEGTRFLDLFLKEINFTGLDSGTAKVEIEKHIGLIPGDYEYGGRVDIFISDQKNNAILIENKIYAGDQHKQLYRYYKYCTGKTKKNNFKIIYLNIDGTPPSRYSTEGNDYTLKEGINFQIVSYKENIINWLKACREKTESKPIVKEAINHYIILIENLTGQSNLKKMEKEIENLLFASEENFKAAKNIKALFDRAEQELYRKFKLEIKKQGGLRNEIEWEQFLIIFQLDEEYKAWYFSFSIKTSDRKFIDNKSIQFQRLVQIINEIDNKFKNDNNNLGWKFADSIKKISELSENIKFDLFRTQYREDFVEKLLNEGKTYWDEFENKIKNIY